ncbi:hypothetical protein GCM10029978_113870 [Actinoallomurus acanthiterrae]
MTAYDVKAFGGRAIPLLGLFGIPEKDAGLVVSDGVRYHAHRLNQSRTPTTMSDRPEAVTDSVTSL